MINFVNINPTHEKRINVSTVPTQIEMPALRTSSTQKTKHEPVLLNIGLAVIRNIKKALGAISDPERKYYPSAPADWLEIPGSYPNLRAAWITKKYTARWFKFVELQRELRHKAD